MFKFDLERALRGDELITRGGVRVTGFVSRGYGLNRHYPYRAENDIYTNTGSFYGTSKDSKDLFMKYEKEPGNFAPQGDVTMAQKTHPADLINGKVEFTRLKTGAPLIEVTNSKYLEVGCECSAFDLDYVLVNGIKFIATDRKPSF